MKIIITLFVVLQLATTVFAAGGAFQIYNNKLSFPDGSEFSTAPKDGKTIYSGSGAPTISVNVGDFYIDTTNKVLYGPYTGTWSNSVSLVGSQGIQGPKGDSGATGLNGLNSVLSLSIEAQGANCLNGGVKIQVGIDSNSNGVLDTSEINHTQTKFVCNSSSSSLTQIQLGEINSRLIAYRNAINSGATSSLLLPFFSTNYLNQGLSSNQEISSILSTMSNNGYLIDTSILDFISYDSVNKILKATTNELWTKSGGYSIVRSYKYDDISGKWKLYGNQFAVQVVVDRLSPDGISTVGTSFGIFDPAASLASVTVSGPGIPATLSLNVAVPNQVFSAQISNYSPAYMDTYTFTITQKNSSVITYSAIYGNHKPN